jgi:hypothetical protein
MERERTGVPASGLYIVTLNNETPISVNAQDPRVADRAIRVTRANCKFGKAKVLVGRKKNYDKTFGEENVNFFPIVAMEDIEVAERAILKQLLPWRVRGSTNRPNEWLHGISPWEVEVLVLKCLNSLDLPFVQIGSVTGLNRQVSGVQ